MFRSVSRESSVLWLAHLSNEIHYNLSSVFLLDNGVLDRARRSEKSVSEPGGVERIVMMVVGDRVPSDLKND